MAVTGFLHHIGTFFLFAATILILITTISAPVVNDIGLLKVTLGNATNSHYSEVSFGTFGYCVLNTANDNHDYCTQHHVGYDAADVMASIDDTSFSDASRDTANGLTHVMVLHPIATGISFIAFLLALGAGFFGSFLAAIVAALAFIVTIVVMIIDFVLFGIIKDHVNSSSDDTSGSHAKFSVAMWTILAGAICLLIGAVIVFFTCCSARLHKRRANRSSVAAKSDYGTATTSRRRRWF
ncbi:pali-domain-containing protein [Cryphonectria parasitica EP155]|uniref:Pali-domain-containing protein n=1 Tax=Cryphonectria parasitica (strain ATCC 38755 / EP155) TaxID=660469 RepID=A0A9P4XU93_CRYP1|nr:pali-domain-containing protein [Cryphonectria parasitica EP155]KAF3761026.1 pali-domain-containing protein [Cryphonectria parasitica EP155]